MLDCHINDICLENLCNREHSPETVDTFWSVSSFKVESKVVSTSVGSEIVSGLFEESLVPALVVSCLITSPDDPSLLWDCSQLSLEVLLLNTLPLAPVLPLLLLFVLDAEECAGEFKCFAECAILLYKNSLNYIIKSNNYK